MSEQSDLAGQLVETAARAIVACVRSDEHEPHRHRMHPDPRYGDVQCPGVATVTHTSWRGARPQIVVLCGSTRFKEDFERAERDFGREGKIVLTVSMFGHSGDLPPEQCVDGHPVKAKLDELHKRKIDLADSVYVVNAGGYLGASTRSEIRYAWSVAHKPVRFMWTMPDEHHSGRMHGLCVHGESRGTCPGSEFL